MAPLGISEFTFGYAFLYEQTHANWGKLTAAPVLPSLQQEKAAGWDAHLPLMGTDYYYQFKLSEYLRRANAKYISDKTYGGPYYRIALHRKDNNHQHQALKRHSLANQNTFYVAPEFNSLDDFNAAFLARQIANRTRLIPVEECDDINDGDQHYITFRDGDTAWIQHSERKKHERSSRGEDLGDLYRASRPRWKAIDREFAIGVFERTRNAVHAVAPGDQRWPDETALPLFEDAPEQATRGEILRRAADLLSVTLGVTLVLVGEGD